MQYTRIEISVDEIFNQNPNCNCDTVYLFLMNWLINKKIDTLTCNNTNGKLYDLARIKKSKDDKKNNALKKVLDNFENQGIGKYYFIDSLDSSKNSSKLLFCSKKGDFLLHNNNACNIIFTISGEECIIINQYILNNFQKTLEKILKSFSERDAIIFRYYNGVNCEKKSISEISQLIGISYTWTKELVSKTLRKCRHPQYWKLLMGRYYGDTLANELYAEINLFRCYDNSYNSLYDFYMPQIIKKNHIIIKVDDKKYRIIIGDKEFKISCEDKSLTEEFALSKIIEMLDETSIFTKYIPKPIVKFSLIEGYITIEKLLENSEEFRMKYLKDRRELLEFFDDFCKNYTRGYLDEFCVFPISNEMQALIEKSKINNLSKLEKKVCSIDNKELLQEADGIYRNCYEFKWDDD